ncbi:Oxysterol-binding protein 3 [Coemansia sp. RSA 552]|nr:Oxysterol-binding protein 3 [Coemansia sp. RSA 552]
MEEVEILPRDAYLHTVNVAHAPCTIQWWFSTKRKNIDFGLFQRGPLPQADNTSLHGGPPGQPGSRESTIGSSSGRRLGGSPGISQSLPPVQGGQAQRGGYFKLQDRNVVERMGLKHYESSKTTIKGSWNAVEPGVYILYFDNSFSKNTSKRLSFCVAVKEARQSSNGSRQPVAMSGWLLKKKRKRMQGWASRWLSIQGSWLLYSTTEGGIPRAKVDIVAAVVSTSKADRTITVDGDEGFLQLRAQSSGDFDAWVAALKKTKEQTVATTPGDGATFSAGAAVQSPPSTAREAPSRQRTIHRDGIPAKAQQAHAGFESSLGQLEALIYNLDIAPDTGFHDRAQGFLRQVRDSEDILYNNIATAHTSGRPVVSRKDTATSDRPSLAHTDTQGSWFSGSGSDIFYDTNEILELARNDPDRSPATNSSQFTDTARPAALRVSRMRRDLIRDPDFIEALAQNNLRSPRPVPNTEGIASATEQAGDGHKDAQDAKAPVDVETHPQATIEHVRAQVGKYEPRTELPAEATEANVGIVSILRKNVGKDISSIAMPLAMNEPINALQALCEELVYNTLLQRADEMDDSLDRLMHVAAFAISALSIKKHRAERKPFNPLLGETYEMVDPLSGFRFMSEKVSHHPVVMACCADAPSFRLWQDSSGKSKFWGKSIEFIQTSNVHIELLTHADHFTYCKPSALVRGLITGDRSVDYTGEMTIVNHATGDRCTVNFKEAGMFTSSNDAVECRLYRGRTSRTVERVLRGSWSSHLRYEISPTQAETIWTAVSLPPGADHYYNFGYFTMRLNELLPDTKGDLPPTDTRFRPDQRAYEEGDVDAAETLKNQLEEAQRARKRDRDAAGAEWSPMWFEEAEDPDSSSGRSWQYKGGYWAARASHTYPLTVDLWNPQ